MGTLTISSPAQVTGTSYASKVGRAARALLDAILAIRPRAAEEPAVELSASKVRAKARGDISLYRLYCLSAPYDSVMPNLRQELEVMACRND